MPLSKSDRFQLPSCGYGSNLPVSRLKYAFLTNSDGSIKISQDWDYVLYALGTMPEFFMRVDHEHGRLLMKIGRKEFFHSYMGASVGTGFECGLDYTGWAKALARIEVCKCCGSPGELAFMNEDGRAFMYVTASSRLPLNDWARVLNMIALDAKSENAPERQSSKYDYLALPEDAVDLELGGADCLRILRELSRSRLPLELAIHAPELMIRKSLKIDRVSGERGLLECYGEEASFYARIESIRSAAAHFRNGRIHLLLLGSQEELLFSVRPQEGGAYEAAFIQALGL